MCSPLKVVSAATTSSGTRVLWNEESTAKSGAVAKSAL